MERARNRGTPRRRRLAAVLVFGTVVAVSALVAGTVVIRGQVGLQTDGETVTPVQDFASHVAFARAVWRGEIRRADVGSAYSVDAHLRFMADWAGRPAEAALPFGYSPTMLWVLLPLTLLPVTAAYLLWSALGAAGVGWMLSAGPFHRISGLMVFLTPIAAGAVALGQTAFLGVVGTYVLVRGSLSRPHAHDALATGLGLGAVLWALGAKPPLAVTAAAALLAVGAVRPVLVAVGLTAVGAAALTPWLGTAWVADYAALIASYDRVGADPAFAWSLRPDHMSNLRALLSVDLGVADDVAAAASNLVWLAALGWVAVAGWRRWLRPGAAWGLAILSYLLLCSHVSSTDELLLALVPAAAAPWADRAGSWKAYLPWVAVPVALLLSPALGPTQGVRPSLLLVLEVALVAWVLTVGTRRRSRTETGPFGATGGQQGGAETLDTEVR